MVNSGERIFYIHEFSYLGDEPTSWGLVFRPTNRKVCKFHHTLQQFAPLPEGSLAKVVQLCQDFTRHRVLVERSTIRGEQTFFGRKNGAVHTGSPKELQQVLFRFAKLRQRIDEQTK